MPSGPRQGCARTHICRLSLLLRAPYPGQAPGQSNSSSFRQPRSSRIERTCSRSWRSASSPALPAIITGAQVDSFHAASYALRTLHAQRSRFADEAREEEAQQSLVFQTAHQLGLLLRRVAMFRCGQSTGAESGCQRHPPRQCRPTLLR